MKTVIRDSQFGEVSVDALDHLAQLTPVEEDCKANRSRKDSAPPSVIKTVIEIEPEELKNHTTTIQNQRTRQTKPFNVETISPLQGRNHFETPYNSASYIKQKFGKKDAAETNETPPNFLATLAYRFFFPLAYCFFLDSTLGHLIMWGNYSFNATVAAIFGLFMCMVLGWITTCYILSENLNGTQLAFYNLCSCILIFPIVLFFHTLYSIGCNSKLFTTRVTKAEKFLYKWSPVVWLIQFFAVYFDARLIPGGMLIPICLVGFLSQLLPILLNVCGPGEKSF